MENNAEGVLIIMHAQLLSTFVNLCDELTVEQAPANMLEGGVSGGIHSLRRKSTRISNISIKGKTTSTTANSCLPLTCETGHESLATKAPRKIPSLAFVEWSIMSKKRLVEVLNYGTSDLAVSLNQFTKAEVASFLLSWHVKA